MHLFFIFVNRLLPGQMGASLNILLGKYSKTALEKLETVDVAFAEVRFQ
jgi:hypothetical protein